MIQNVNSQKVYALPGLMPMTQDYSQQLPIPCVAPCPMPQAGLMPVYNSIPYNPVYGNMGQYRQPTQFAPKISTVSIEMNGLEPPKVPGCNDFQGQQPVYPGMTQMPQYMPQYQQMPQMMPQYQQMPEIPQQVGMQPVPATIPPSSMVGAIPPAPQYIQQPQPEVATPAPPVIDQAPKAETVQQNPQQDQEAVKPLMEALNAISPKQGAPELTIDQQAKAIQTIAQFSRVAEAANQLSKTNPESPEAKQTKEKVDTLIKPSLIKEETFLGLADIATKDTSKLAVEDKKKADENRIISMWTLAMLQKLFKQEMNQEAQKINIPPISMNEVPGIVQVADIVKKDTNPEVREAGIAALINLADPQDKKDVETMRTILTEALNDKYKNVSDAAKNALKIYSEEETSKELK